MMGPKQEAQAALFCEFFLDDHVSQDHLLRSIDRFVDLDDIWHYLAEFTATQAAHPRPGSALKMHERGLILNC